MNIDIDKAKMEVQKGSTHYIVGIKFVTNEDAENVFYSIKKDMMIYKNVAMFVVRDNIIEIILSNNATLCAYYFTNKEVLDDVVEKLNKLLSEPRPRLLIH